MASYEWPPQGGGGGGGTVTSVGLVLPSIFTVTVSPVTISGSLTAVLANEPANTVFAGPASGSAAAPTFRALALADIPSLSTLYLPLAGGTMSGAIAMGGNKITGLAQATVSGDAVSLNPAGKIPVGFMPAAVFLYQGAWNASTNTPTLQDATGVQAGYVYWISVAGTGPISGLSNASMQGSLPVGDLVIFNGTQYELVTPAAGVQSVNAATGAVTLTASTTISGLSLGWTGAALSLTGTLGVPGGGTGAITLTSHGVLYGNGTSAIGATAAGTTGQVLQGNTGSAPTWGAIPTTYPTALLVLGDGIDGAGSYTTGTTTLTRNMYFSSLNVAVGATLVSGGFQIFVNGVATINGNVNNNGNAASGTTGGAALATGKFYSQGSGAGTSGVSNSTPGSSTSFTAGGGGGVGGSGGGSSSGYGSAAGAITALSGPAAGQNHGFITAMTGGTFSYSGNYAFVNYSGSGGTGGVALTGTGGGGGGAGGPVFIAAASFAGSGTITSTGGNGGSATGTTAGGGGGGGGGTITLMSTQALSATSTITASAAGGTGGTGVGTGVTGATGSSGTVIQIVGS